MPVVVSVAPAASVRNHRVLPLVPTQHTLGPSAGGSVRRRLGKIRNALGKAILAFAVSYSLEGDGRDVLQEAM